MLATLSTSAPAEPSAALYSFLNGRSLRATDRQRLIETFESLTPRERRAFLGYMRLDPRIVGGTPAAIARFPWQVALIEGRRAGRRQYCGGSLIAPDVVVTAAHCIDNPTVGGDASRVDVIAGTGTYGIGGERIEASAVVVHPQYVRSRDSDFDVALILLATPSALGRPIRIDDREAPVGTNAWVTGWGAIRDGGMGTDDLLGAEVPVVDTAVCNAPESHDGAITARMLCAGQRAGGVDSCQGDSGGPLAVVDGANTRLIGIVSWGHGCAQALKYGVYTRVSSVARWIRSVLRR
jgi:transmembrane serine protease 11D